MTKQPKFDATDDANQTRPTDVVSEQKNEVAADPNAVDGQSSAANFKNQLTAAKLPKETREFMRSRQVAANFGNIVTVLMQSADHRDLKLSELRDYVVPALVNNQFRVAEAHKKGSGHTVPVGVILWARVSKDLDSRLSNTELHKIVLKGEEWVSGDNIWIMEIVGDQRFIGPLLLDLQKKEFKGRTVKYRQQDEDKIVVSTLRTNSKN